MVDGLVWCAGPIERRLSRLPGALRGSLAVTLAAQLFVFPVLASVFGSFSAQPILA